MRRVTKFDDWMIPTLGREEPNGFSVRDSSLTGFRTDGQYSSWGNSRAPLDQRDYKVTFTLSPDETAFDKEANLESKKDTMLATFMRGRKRLYFRTLGSSDPEFFGFAYVKDVDFERSITESLRLRVTVVFHMDNPVLYRPLSSSDITGMGFTAVEVAANQLGETWEERTFASFTVNSSPYTFTIVNTGHLRTTRVLVRLESLGSAGFTNPKVENVTHSQSIQSTFDAVDANSRWQVNCYTGFSRVRSSLDAGASWSSDWPNTTLGDSQATILELAPGGNLIKYTDGGTPNLRVMVLWLPSYLF